MIIYNVVIDKKVNLYIYIVSIASRMIKSQASIYVHDHPLTISYYRSQQCYLLLWKNLLYKYIFKKLCTNSSFLRTGKAEKHLLKTQQIMQDFIELFTENTTKSAFMSIMSK